MRSAEHDAPRHGEGLHAPEPSTVSSMSQPLPVLADCEVTVSISAPLASY